MPDNWLFLLGVALLPAFLTLWIGFRLGIVSERHNSRRQSQLIFVPFLKRIIIDISKAHPFSVWFAIKSKVQDAVWEFEMHLKWPRRKAFERAWKECDSIKDTDLFPNNNPGFVSKGEAEDIKEAREHITSPLEQLLYIAESA